METALQLISDTFRLAGYQGVQTNLWNESRIYVNLTSKHSFSYDLTQDFKISSKVKLSAKDFAVARCLIAQIRSLIIL